MVTEVEYALMAGRAYQSTRAEINVFPSLVGWSEPLDKREVNTSTGFEASYFQRGNEIVISFAGTNPSELAVPPGPDNQANIGLATGVDSLRGGAGNDTYMVDNVSDTVTENLNEGTDLVQSSVTSTLGTNVENLTLTGTTAINGTGNTLDNVLTGNSAANVLTGGAGNDTYVVTTGDTVTEAASAGTDTVQSGVTWTLGANVENLTLTGTSAINGTGNTLNNTLVGNSGANVLSGGSGSGSTHSPFLASRASFSSFSSSVFPGAYFRYHQHYPHLINFDSAPNRFRFT